MSKRKPSAPPSHRRLIKIDELIRAKKYPNKPALAKQLEVSEKTIQRDIDYMKSNLDAPIKFDSKKNGYCYIEENYFLPSLNLNEKNLFALVVAEKILKHYESASYYSELKSAMDKLMTYLPDEVALPTMRDVVSYHTFPLADGNAEKLHLVREALFKLLAVEMEYHTSYSDEKKTRYVNPYHLLFHNGAWYLIGYCHSREDVRVFSLSRILWVKMTTEKFEMPKGFSVDAYFQSGFKRGESSYPIELKFSPKIAPFIRDRQWYSGEEKEMLADGSLRLKFTVPTLYEVIQFTLKYGGDVEVLKPRLLRRLVAEEAAKITAIYKS